MTVDVDNATLPVDNSLSSPASEGAGELRALKAKLNQLYLNAGVAATYPGLIDCVKGLNVGISDGSNIVLQSGRFKIIRTASQPKDTLGMYSESVLNNNVTTPANIISAFYAITTANPGATFQGMYSLNSLVQQMNHAGSGAVIGLNVFFANRTSPGIAAPGGLGANRYNQASFAMVIDSYDRSTAGEYSGWKTGIKFTSTSLDQDWTGSGYAIDISGLNRSLTADPLTSYRAKAAIRLSNMLSIVWDDVESVTTFYDPASQCWTMRCGVNNLFAVSVVDGKIYRNGVFVI